MLNWLSKRLSPVKIDEPRWNELAAAIQTFWETFFDVEFEKLFSIRSIYTADDEGQRKIVAEMGGYFAEGLPVENRAVLVAMRKLELLQKETDIPLQAGIQRIGIQGVKWEPLYALESDGPYGTAFYHAVVGIPEGAYMTSRGLLTIELTDLPFDASVPQMEEWVRAIKPEHIVFDGSFFSLTIRKPAPINMGAAYAMTEAIEVYPATSFAFEDDDDIITEEGDDLMK